MGSVNMNQTFEEFKRELKTKKIAIIGAGVSNVPLLAYLGNLGCQIILFDKKRLEELNEDVRDVIKKNNIKLSLGENYLEKLENFDVIFRSPSFLPNQECLRKEQKKGALITTEIEQVIKFAPGPIIGITGSKGKTTTTTIIDHILKKLGYSTYLGGNIGIPLFTKLDQMTSKDVVVLELSSFQLMEMSVSPHIAVITNISADHLDVHTDYSEYIEAKKAIFQYQDSSDILVLNLEDEIVKNFVKEAKGNVKFFGNTEIEGSYYLEGQFIKYHHKRVIDTNKLILKGKHNYLNVCAALNAISSYIQVSNNELEQIVATIPGVAHRLEFVREINGVKWYNDSASTTPDKSKAGIYAFSEKVVLIAGGYDKNISYEPLAKPILERVSKLILFGSTKNKIYDVVMKQSCVQKKNVQVYVMDTLEEVIEVAYQVSIPGEVVLFSPASASFDMFKNAYQRGDLFKKIVEKL